MFGTIEQSGGVRDRRLLVQVHAGWGTKIPPFEILSDKLSPRDQLAVAVAIPMLLGVVKTAESRSKDPHANTEDLATFERNRSFPKRFKN